MNPVHQAQGILEINPSELVAYDRPEKDVLRGTAIDEAVRDSSLVIRGCDINSMRDRDFLAKLRRDFELPAAQVIVNAAVAIPDPKWLHRSEYQNAYYARKRAAKLAGIPFPTRKKLTPEESDERRLEYHRKRAAEKRARQQEYNKRWKEKNLEHVREQHREYNREYRARKKVETAAYNREYRKTHAEYFKQKNREYQLKKKAARLKEAS